MDAWIRLSCRFTVFEPVWAICNVHAGLKICEHAAARLHSCHVSDLAHDELYFIRAKPIQLFDIAKAGMVGQGHLNHLVDIIIL